MTLGQETRWAYSTMITHMGPETHMGQSSYHLNADTDSSHGNASSLDGGVFMLRLQLFGMPSYSTYALQSAPTSQYQFRARLNRAGLKTHLFHQENVSTSENMDWREHELNLRLADILGTYRICKQYLIKQLMKHYLTTTQFNFSANCGYWPRSIGQFHLLPLPYYGNTKTRGTEDMEIWDLKCHIPLLSGSSWKSENSLGLPAELYLRRTLLMTVCVWSRLLNCQQQNTLTFYVSGQKCNEGKKAMVKVGYLLYSIKRCLHESRLVTRSALQSQKWQLIGMS